MSAITTYSNIRFDPMSPKNENIVIEDIAHALSLLCRAGGHFRSFYSVAQHSINCMNEARARGYSKHVQLACLLHDGSEAYLSDITRPVKKHLHGYHEIEHRLQTKIYEKWLSSPLADEELAQLHDVDDTLLHHEFLHFMGKPADDISQKPSPLLSVPQFDFECFAAVEHRFLRIFHSLLVDEGEPPYTVGVDGHKGRWIAVEKAHGVLTYQIFDTIAALCQQHNSADAILIDIPIGLPESASEMAHRPDSVLMKALSRKSSSVFHVPFRQIAMAETLEEAWDLSRSLGAKMQPPGMAIRGAVAQVDRYLQEHITWKNKLLESHPEYAFLVLNHYVPLSTSKRSLQGQAERKAILRHYCDGLDALVEQYLTDVPGRKKIDDLLDATALAVIGELGLRYGFTMIPDNPKQDATGLYMQIVSAKL